MKKVVTSIMTPAERVDKLQVGVNEVCKAHGLSPFDIEITSNGDTHNPYRISFEFRNVTGDDARRIAAALQEIADWEFWRR